MNIIQVSFERLKTFGQYENIRIGAVATVPEGACFEDCLKEVQEWVDTQISEKIDHPELMQLTYQKEHLERAIKERKEQLKRLIDAAKTLEKYTMEEP
jgi:hypothetical protein